MSRPAEGGFARAALQSGCRFSAGLAEARALMAAGRPEEAESVLSGLTAPDDRDETTLALVRAWNLFWTLDRPDEAETVLTAGERALTARAGATTTADARVCATGHAAPAARLDPRGAATGHAGRAAALRAGAATTLDPRGAATGHAGPATTLDPGAATTLDPRRAAADHAGPATTLDPGAATTLDPRRAATGHAGPATTMNVRDGAAGHSSAAAALDAPTTATAVLVTAGAVAPRAACCTWPAHAPGIAELYALRARFAFAQGDPHAALAIAAPIEADECAPEAARIRAAVALAEALAVCGRRDEAVAVARRWEPASQRQLAGAQALAHWLAGSLHEATYEAERAYAAATDAQGWAVAALLLGHVWLSRGDTEAALRWFRESSVLLRGSDPVAMRPAALAGIAQAAAQAGDAAHAQAALDELDRIPQPAGRGVGEELGLARAWTAHVSGDHQRAVAIATAVLATAEARGADGFAARARAELARLY